MVQRRVGIGDRKGKNTARGITYREGERKRMKRGTVKAGSNKLC
jgi:hypothetical protein